ncbi:MAG TPA: TIGR04551 family protein [Enhygromyxa sp.]|nr:TIGR04551 family protein [Enhygromyxa sp.]
MPELRRPLSFAGPVLALSLGLGVFGIGFESTALASPPPPGGGMGGMPGGGAAPTGPEEGDKEGPAEAAPKDKGALAPVVPVPAQPESRRRLQLFELHGNLRMRADYFHRLDLALEFNENDQGGNKFFVPPAETNETTPDGPTFNQANCAAQLSARGVSQQRIGSRCARRRGAGGGNLRLRLEPTIHVTDTIKIHAQVDLLDNLVLGSTPDSFAADNPWAPIDLFTRTQFPPTEGINSFNDSITVKRAWGEVRFGFGLKLEFGRMPNHWGLGIVQNDGNGYARGEQADIIRMVDTDYGDSVDTVRLSFDFGPDKRNAITLGVSYDWAASGPTTAQLLGPRWASGNLTGQTFSAELYDNVHQFSVWVERHDDANMLQRKLSAGTPVVNYGLKTWMRWQNIDRAIGAPGLGDGLSGNSTLDPELDPEGIYHAGVPLGNGGYDEDGDDGLQNYANSLVHRRGWLLTPDLWLRINWRTMRIEAEAAVVVGSFRHRDMNVDRSSDEFNIDVVVADELTRVFQAGYALEFKYGLFQDRLHIGVDHGFASGDSSPPHQFNYTSPMPYSDPDVGPDYAALGTFRFNPAYMQDLLLFRELLGTVANAAYVKPWLAFYFFQNNLSARADIEFAGAVDRRGTLAGDKSLWGLELAASARYHDADEPLFFQLQYGVMFPFGAWQPVVERVDANGDPTRLRLDGKAAQTIQAQLGIRF